MNSFLTLRLSGFRIKHVLFLIVLTIFIFIQDIHGVFVALVTMEDVIAVDIMLHDYSWRNVPVSSALFAGWYIDIFSRVNSLCAHIDSVIVRVNLTFQTLLLTLLVFYVEIIIELS